MKEYELCCPKCLKRAGTANPFFIRYSFYRLELPIFLCVDCRTIYIDKPTIRRIISKWRRGSGGATKIPFEKLCREFTHELEEMVDGYWKERGYKKMRFVKGPKK